ncbi:hypothetical protein [Xanthomonas maliensis]|uniref:hypothetical protein n=1 Tax=Xanthomonas maliensis TaxID=1321368 RepID=UPI00039FEF41|nr:hypothetical protein CKY51_19960 [Xanthomonas maliensis]
MTAPPTAQSHSARLLFMLILGLVIGLICTVMAARALQARRDPVPDSLMQVMALQMRQLQATSATCTPAVLQRRLQTLRLLADDLQPAFGTLGEDRRFAEHAQALRSTLDQALAQPARCADVRPLQARIDGVCSDCHRDFR